MSKTEIKIIPSVLDRLLDYEPHESVDPPKSRTKSLSELKQSVRRDLERLLNSKFIRDEIPEDLEEVNQSMAIYGLPDFSTLSSKNNMDKATIVNHVSKALKLFEPRFVNLKVMIEETDIYSQGLRFRIQASLKVEPTPEPVVFDTVLQVGSGEFSVKEK